MSDALHKLVKLLNEIITLDYDAIEAYEAAIERLQQEALKERFTAFCEDHRRHTQNVSQLVAGFGGRHAKGPGIKRFLTTGKVVLADIVGEDHAILLAMRLNEEVTNQAYDDVLAIDDLDPTAREVLEENRADERRHREWIEHALA